MKLLYLLVLVGAVSLAGFVSVSGNGVPEGVSVFEAGGRTCVVFPDGSGECFCECEPDCIPVDVVPAGTPVIPVTDTPDIPAATPSEEATPVISTPAVTPEVTKQACGQNKDANCGHGNDGDQRDNDNPHGGPSQGQPGSGRDEEQGGTKGGRHDK